METNEKTKENGILSIILVIVLILTVVMLAGFAYARYATQKSGQAQAQIAKWSFKVYDGLTHTENINNLSITRTDNNTEVDSNTIAPGTSGVFQMDVDARRNRNKFNL